MEYATTVTSTPQDHHLRVEFQGLGTNWHIMSYTTPGQINEFRLTLTNLHFDIPISANIIVYGVELRRDPGKNHIETPKMITVSNPEYSN
uniref:Uncharacterized protein n=1 Tax=Phlebotomus papatasi TaxID=29031 RepID=A0A1B0D8K6_PHLPP